MNSFTTPNGPQYEDFPYISSDSNFLIPAALSFCSTLLVVLFTSIKKFWHCPLSTMIFASNLMDTIFFSSKLSAFWYAPESSPYCKIMRIIFNFVYFSLMIWKACFGHAFYSILKARDTMTLSENLKYYTLFALLVPFFSVLSSIFTSATNYSPETRSCVDRLYLNKLDWSLMLYAIIPCLFTIFLNIRWYIWAYRELKSVKLKGEIKESLTLILYPGVLIVCWLPIFLLESLVQFGVSMNQNLIKWLTTFAYLMGFFNAMIYVEGKQRLLRRIGKRVRRHYRKNSEKSNKIRGDLKSLALESESSLSQAPKLQLHVTDSFMSDASHPDHSITFSSKNRESSKYELMQPS